MGHIQEKLCKQINTEIQKATGKAGEACPQCSIDTASFRTIFALPITTSNPAAFLQLAFNRTRGGHTVTDISSNNNVFASCTRLILGKVL